MTAPTPDLNHLYDVIIVGGGVAGSAAALRAAQYLHRTLWVRGTKLDAKRSRAQWVYNIDNMVGVHDGIVRKKVCKLLRGDGLSGAREKLEAAPHMPISTRDIVDNVVDRIDDGYASWVTHREETATGAGRREDGSFVVTVGSHEYHSRHLVLATGVMDRQPEILKTNRKGELQDDIKWIYPAANREQVLYCIRCEGHLTRGRQVAVIGSTEAAAQIAMMLHERYKSATVILTNGDKPAWSDKSGRLLEIYGIQVQGARITSIDAGRESLKAIQLEDGTEIDAAFGLVSMGIYQIYNELAIQLGAELGDKGQPDRLRHVRIDACGETSIHNLFVVGDLAQRPDEPVMKQVYTSQEYAVRALDLIDRRMRSARREAALGQEQ
ncbi:MAG: FAD-dependent oxidoreductase [Planctomycetes bacterium]|nr:FAD-dependent oxidoreductase [Planctomycetota bacterium]